MTILGEIRVLEYLQKTSGEVIGRQISDGKDRVYKAVYSWREVENGLLAIRRNGSTEESLLPSILQLDEVLIAFFGLYSGDGAKGSEDQSTPGKLRTAVSFCQREPNLVKLAVAQFKRIFPEARFTFSLGEDSAYFFTGAGLERLKQLHKGTLPSLIPLSTLMPSLRSADNQYLRERRHSQADPIADLAFYYQFKDDMQKILTEEKEREISSAGIVLGIGDRITSSLRRPYKKGAREPGGTSRSDETHVGNVAGMGELFLKMLHEIEDSILHNQQISSQGLIHWKGLPENIGEEIDVKDFFLQHPYGKLAGRRPAMIESGLFDSSPNYISGRWNSSKTTLLSKKIRISPLWCYTSGLYLAEGSGHDKLFEMFDCTVSHMALGFTSSDDVSLELIIRSLQSLFTKSDCVETWKVKVGSQYFPELVVVGLKNAVPMLRGGHSGDGKLRTMEISLSIKKWALEVAPVMIQYQDKYSHVEPTGAGVPRIDFAASSSLCRWYFPLLMYSVFGKLIPNPEKSFVHD